MPKLTRRAVLFTGGGLLGLTAVGALFGVGYLSSIDTDGVTPETQSDGTISLNAYVHFKPDGVIEIAIPRTEMGQGIWTGAAGLIAEELELDLNSSNVHVVHPVERLPVYVNSTLGLDVRPEDQGVVQWFGKKFFASFPYIGTGASVSAMDAFVSHRRIGATARLMLVAAAAARWSVNPSTCVAASGRVLHAASDQSLSFSELAADAALLPPPTSPPLKPRAEWKVIGQPIPRVDLPDKVTGRAIFGIDVALPGMVYAALRHIPIGGTLERYDESALRGEPGVLDVVDLGDAVAVVAMSWWQAEQALEVHPPAFVGNPALSTDLIDQQMSALLAAGDGIERDARGDVATALSADGTVLLDATYSAPMQTHAFMEPRNATALVGQDNSVEVWGSAQSPLMLVWGAERAMANAGKEINGEIRTHVTVTGGAFGGRSEIREFRECVALAARMPGVPVKLIYSRPEDMRHGGFRSGAVARLRASLRDSRIDAYAAHVVGQPLEASWGPRNTDFAGESDGTEDEFTIEGLHNPVYSIPNLRIGLTPLKTAAPISFWRSNGYSFNVFFSECFIDECATALNADPLDLRIDLAGGDPRALAVLQTLKGQFQRPTKRPAGKGYGVAFFPSFRSYCAHGVELTLSGDTVVIDRVVSVLDAGLILNPDIARSQIEGSIIWGLSAAIYGRISMADGLVDQSYFTDYPVVTLVDAPRRIEVHLLEGDDRPGGVGEPGVSPIAAAFANALSQARATRIRTLPIFA